MTDKVISSIHIQKLGHEIQEIRERALNNIISKLDHGFVYDNDLARSKEILSKLFEWFLFEPCTKQELVFSLIKRILQSESGKTLIEHHGTSLMKQELKRISSYLEPKFYQHLEEISRILETQQVIVPPLETDIPLSYRTGQTFSGRRPVDSTATTIKGTIHQDASISRGTCNFSPVFNTPNPASTCRIDKKAGIYVISPLRWQYLIEADRHVLQSVENSLRNPPEPSALLHSSEFFNNILLQDFPAEIFLQRPTIVNVFYDLLRNCPSTRVINSVLNCLCNLTKSLQVRVNHYNDPCMYNLKEAMMGGSRASSACSSPDSITRRTISGQSVEEYDRAENAVLLKDQQMSFPRFCCVTIRNIFKYLRVKPDDVTQTKRKLNHVGINLSVVLLEEILNLITQILSKEVWNEETNSVILGVFQELNDTLVEFGDILEYLRLEACSNDSRLNFRATQLCLLKNCTKFLVKLIPLSQSGLILPRNLKDALTNCLVDVILAKLYPEIYNTILQYVQSFSTGLETDPLVKYEETDKVCKSMTSAVQFLRTHKSLNAAEGVFLAKSALPCLGFHKDLSFVRYYVDLCANKLPIHKFNEDILKEFEFVTLKLLAHNLDEIREEMYRLCQKRVIAAIGPKFNHTGAGAPGSQILFLLRIKILTEIGSYGLTSDNLQIEKFAEDILIHVVKCKILVSDDVWNNTVQAMISTLPVLLCFAGKDSSLGRSLVDIIDPDTARGLFIPEIEIVKSNVHILFSKDNLMREEAFSRLCWLLASDFNSRDMLPRLNNLSDRALPNVCQIQRILDVNKYKNNQHFYRPSSLQQVLDLLKSDSVEPVIRRSALTQASVMMEDPLLHATFLEDDGLNLVVNVMNTALTERNFRDYPDSVIPAVSILKNICLYQSSARLELSIDIQVYHFVLRALFMYFTEERLRQDATCLLFMLVFNDFIIGSPSKGDFSIPELATSKIHVPFVSRTHGSTSQYREDSFAPLLIKDKNCLSSIQIQWNLENFGFDELLLWKQADYTGKHVTDILQLQNYDLSRLKASAVEYCAKKYLIDIQNGTSHDSILDSLNKLTKYVYLVGSSKNDQFRSLPWESTLVRFLKTLPSSDSDAKLLNSVLKFLQLLVPFYKASEESFWLAHWLRTPSSCLLDLINLDNDTTDEHKALSQNFLSLVTLCATQEQHFLDFYNYHAAVGADAFLVAATPSSWKTVIEIIADNLQFSDATHFYNLAYLDSLLACLVHLTATLGWSGSRSGAAPKKVLSQIISSLCELIVVFHCGKGPTAAISVMGLSITRHAVLILNHLLAEMHHCKVRDWEVCFVEIEDEWLKSFLVLWSSRDVVLRAAAVQLFAGLALSPRLAIEIVNELKDERQGVWELALDILVDHGEASVVRENCANFLTNLTAHTTLDGTNAALLPSLVPKKPKKGGDGFEDIFILLEDYQFYKSLVGILNCLYTNHLINVDAKSPLKTGFGDDMSNLSSEGSSSSRTSSGNFITTPGFVKSAALLLLNLLALSNGRVTEKLQDHGLTKLLFRCICDPTMNVDDTRKLSVYCEILEMNAAICGLLNRVAGANRHCLATVIYTRDCLTGLILLLNKKSYHTHLPQLVFLRNKLWSETFQLLTVLISLGNTATPSKHSVEAVGIITDTIEDAGKQPFLETLCEALGSSGYNDIQNCALTFLIALLGVEMHRFNQPKNACRSSMRNFLDTARTPRSISQSSHSSSDSDGDDLAENESNGVKICKILLNLYDLSDLTGTKNIKKKPLVVSALTAVLCVSREAKNFAYAAGLLNIAMKQLRDFHLKLSLESVDCLRRVLDKKRVSPHLKESNELVGLLTNFMVEDEGVKMKLADLGLADLVHKLWVWFGVQKLYLIDALKMMSTFTTGCVLACQSLLLTSSVAGSGPRKVPSNVSLLHAVLNLVEKEMDQVSKTHNLEVLQLCFIILTNCCRVMECRIVLCKSPFLHAVARLHPAITKRQKPWQAVELIWLEFLQNFTVYPEGQSCVAKINDVFELLMILTLNPKSVNSLTALIVLRNIAFYQPNRSRLLTSGDFLNVLLMKLENGTSDERSTVVLIMWSLSANNQKGKVVLKSAQLDVKLQRILKHYELTSDERISIEEVERMRYVLNIIKDGDKVR